MRAVRKLVIATPALAALVLSGTLGSMARAPGSQRPIADPHIHLCKVTAFGEDRLIWGSNWPVSDLGGDFGKQIELAEEYLKPFGPKVRDKVMFRNARDFYRRKPPAHTAR
jgi:predicted TIM-barrel fold metal-dependent hydrolase